MELVMSNEDRRIKENREKYLGKVFRSEKYGQYKVVEYKNSREVTVVFSDNSRGTFKGTDVIRGTVKNRNQKTVFGRGFIGFGRHKLDSPLGKKWSSMMLRCYCESYQKYQTTYKGCEVSTDWLSLQGFCESLTESFVEKFDLDKDLLCIGNKLYSKEYCTFLPREINSTLQVKRVSNNKLPLGVSKTKFGRFYGSTTVGGADHYSTNYTDVADAFVWYKGFKEDLMKVLAEKYKGIIEDSAYQALYNLELSEQGWLTKDELSFKFYENGDVEIPDYYAENKHLITADNKEVISD